MIGTHRWISLVFVIHLSYGWSTVFDFRPCYEKRMDERMPLSIDNFIALVEQFERDHYNVEATQIASAILYRYRTNGVVYNPDSFNQWSNYQLYEVAKQDLDDKLLKPDVETPENSFTPREECSLHMSVSHSTDIYPHAGVDATWDNSNIYSGRKKRAVEAASKNYNYGVDITEPATHPIEFGVIQTASGPIAGGLLLSGIMTMLESRSYSVSELIGKENAGGYMPSEMMSKQIDQLYGSTISGKLGQAAILANKNGVDYNFEIGPIGRFGNCTSCARIFSLENIDYSYFSRAEVFASLDAMIIAKTMQSSRISGSAKLSEILRMYYGEHGLYNENIRSCNRHNVFNTMKATSMDEIQTQALNYMYAYQTYFPELRTLVGQSQDDFSKIETDFTNFLRPIISVYESFLSSYNYDDPDAEPCPQIARGDFQFETVVDMVVVFTPVGTQEDVDKQAQYISATARKIGIGYHRSRLAIYNGRKMNWLTPMTNYSNIADYSCNYTTYMNYATTSSQEFIKILDDLGYYYDKLYTYARRNDAIISTSQVVLWNLPASFDVPSDEYAPLLAWNHFNISYPDVNFLFVGQEPANFFTSIFGINGNSNSGKDAITIIDNSDTDPMVIANDIVDHLKQTPRMFLYPACDTSNSSYFDYNENSHVYINYVTPNFTTLIKIPPTNFMFSEYVKLSFKKNDMDICVSRVNKIPSSDDAVEETTCIDASTTNADFEQYFLCDRYLEDCDPIYISVTGQNGGNNYCNDEACHYPNQVEISMTHEGMICGCEGLVPLPLLLLLLALLHYFRL